MPTQTPSGSLRVYAKDPPGSCICWPKETKMISYGTENMLTEAKVINQHVKMINNTFL